MELLVVIVVIAILAAITIVAYQGIQQRARDAQRAQDVKTIAKALELYYIDNGMFPPGSGTLAGYTSWSTTADASWANLQAYLVPKYISSLPTDPISTPGQAMGTGVYNYSYFAGNGNYCGVGNKQMYIIVYRKEQSLQQNDLIGDCTSNPLLYGASNYRVVK